MQTSNESPSAVLRGRSGQVEKNQPFLLLALGALGVVFGDIGTSPLYALRECFHGSHAMTPTRESILGVLSLIFWSLIVVVSLKYLLFVMRADNRGEGGEIALLALITKHRSRDTARSRRILILMGIFGAALIYGDGVITPAISVLSAIEGLKVATPVFEPFVLPITITILTALFCLQQFGIGRISSVFGPIIFLWFLTLGVLGLRGILGAPEVLAALNPLYAAAFLTEHGTGSLLTLGSVFLVVTGAEALYADMGLFGRSPIRFAWFSFVLPALVLNYFGQGALLLVQPEAAANPFYLLAPDYLLYPLVALATVAAIIASQALISGAFGLTRQAIQLGYLPRLEIRHTSRDEIAQTYVPLVNWSLYLAVVWLVLTFPSSDALAWAYGVAMSITMIITTTLTAWIAGAVWGWPRFVVWGLFAALIIVDLTFFVANFSKIIFGGWFPLLVATLVFILMTTWKKGRALLADRLRLVSMTPERFVRQIATALPSRLPGTAVFMAKTRNVVPSALFHNIRHNHVLHERVLLLTIEIEEVPTVGAADRAEVESLGNGFFNVVLRYGFMDEPDLPEALRALAPYGLELPLYSTTFYLSRETLIATDLPGMALWREQLFAFMSRNAQRAATWFRIPSTQVVEIGVQVEL